MPHNNRHYTDQEESEQNTEHQVPPPSPFLPQEGGREGGREEVSVLHPLFRCSSEKMMMD